MNIANQSFDFTSSTRPGCIIFNITDDDIIERTEYFSIMFVQGSMEVQFINDRATIVIIDNDSKIYRIPKFIIDSVYHLL